VTVSFDSAPAGQVHHALRPTHSGQPRPGALTVAACLRRSKRLPRIIESACLAYGMRTKP